jgi:hypothetical protein
VLEPLVVVREVLEAVAVHRLRAAGLRRPAVLVRAAGVPGRGR